MKIALKKEMKTWNDYRLWNHIFGNTDIREDVFNVALCQLHCNNRKIIQLLTERGLYMQKKNLDKVDYLNEKIDA